MLGLPVLIHTADPVAFFDPVDHRNERLEELGVHPEWSFAGPGFPTFDRLHGVARVARRGASGHDVRRRARGLPRRGSRAASAGCWTRIPNLAIDFSARIAELGRQPRAAAALFRAHAARILFGTDRYPPDLATYRRYFRFLETADEHFAYDDGPVPSQGRWAISALDLADDVLRAIYRDKPRRVLQLEETP